jgi:hypothetical protein
MTFVFLGLAAGGTCALLRYQVFTMLATCVVVAAGATFVGVVSQTPAWAIVASVVGALAALEFTYVAVALTRHLVQSRRQLPQVQAAVGKQLRAELELPYDLPLKLDALIGRLPAG